MQQYRTYGFNFGGSNELENYLFELTLLRVNPIFILLQFIILCILTWIWTILWPLGFMIYFFIVVRYVIKWINETNSFSKLINNILKLYRIYEKDSHKFLGIEEILDSSYEIYQWIIIIDESMKYSFLLTKKSQKKIWELKEFSINMNYKYLTKVRYDLNLRLAEQQKTLESAKSEVEKNIQWTTALEQVSEVQKLRLDRQIEQFEELQRVLVKV